MITPLKKTKRETSLFNLDILSSYGDWSSEEIELMSSLARSHPRQFWSASKRLFTQMTSHDKAWTNLRSFNCSETLLRAGLSLANKSSEPNALGENIALHAALAGCLALPHKRDAFYQARVDSAAPGLKKLSASSIFSLIGSSAISGNASATLAMARLMPDANSADPLEARRHTFGVSGFARTGTSNESDNANAIAFIHAQEHGLKPRALNKKTSCYNPFFWIAHRYLESTGAKSASAALWEQAGLALAQRCPGLADSAETLSLILAIEPFRAAFIAKQPALKDPSFYSFDRSKILAGAFLMAQSSEVKAIIDYANTARSPAIEESSNPAKPGPVYSGGLPAWALALLAGHRPDPAWAPEPGSAEALAAFKLPKAIVDQAKNGSLPVSRLRFEGQGETGASYNAASLCKALGQSLAPAAPKAASAASGKKNKRAP